MNMQISNSGYPFSGYGNSYTGILPIDNQDKPAPILNPGESVEKKPGAKSSPAECETCKNRKYQDGSDEMVSFKAAAHISPQAAGAAVRGHEQEHVSNAYKKAAANNGKVLRASVSIHTSICPECGRSYVSGGTKNTGRFQIQRYECRYCMLIRRTRL